MIQTEQINDRIRHYSDSGLMLRQIETGALYEDAVDIIPCPYTYAETDIPIPPPPAPDGIEPAAQYLLGQNLVEMPRQEQPDYFHENDPEPNYFE